ncbi:2-deoxyribose-5-phosphate aldolase [Candidimonas humi]|uniref:Phosphodeoxyriboaldolase n=1 Tax=Candidimonas humi TaxID=683355 RepID=A0ABV8NWL3_9BURK|nr:deoxyribose-phosphate aldolase [Candidimonas humi]MBV6304149.1 2-deoxyribose-5-phosphate aldolase [Candidimonas humi]
MESTAASVADPAPAPGRNPGMPLDLSWVESLQVNRSAAERRVASLSGRRSVKKDAQAAWLLKALTCIDLTALSGDDTPGRVERLCHKARAPVRAELLEALGMADAGIRVAAVCVYHRYVHTALRALGGGSARGPAGPAPDGSVGRGAASGGGASHGAVIPVAAVSTGFPAGLSAWETHLDEIAASVAAGASEIDIVITREHVLTGNWPALYEEMQAYRRACGPAHVKAILATGDIRTLRKVAMASLVCMMAGADFIKTSTGKESVNATPEAMLVMLRMIREYFDRSGVRVGIKPAGGISTARHALDYLVLVKEELGRRWLEPDLLRLGASSLLADIERQLEHHVTGRYSAFHRHPLG